MEPRLAYLGIGLRPEIWRHCRGLSDDDALAVYSLPARPLGALLGVSRGAAETIRAQLAAIDLKEEAARLKRLNINFVTRADEGYPEGLQQIYDPPAAIFLRGELKGLGLGVAVVGARRCSGYGRAVAEEIAAGLAEAGITVVSGMARGIDSAAHIGALRTGKTVAVLGCGLDIVYPPENRALSAEISKNGALVSEFPPGTPPRPLNFPARNRLISGLSAAVVVVEASKRSGALITADFALGQGKDVLVVPGSVRSPVSAGCHKLLKQGAGVAEGAADVLEAIGYKPRPAAKIQADVEPDAAAVLSLVEFDKTHIDEILARTDLAPHEVLGGLSQLELRGLVCRQAGGWYIRLK